MFVVLLIAPLVPLVVLRVIQGLERISEGRYWMDCRDYERFSRTVSVLCWFFFWFNLLFTLGWVRAQCWNYPEVSEYSKVRMGGYSKVHMGGYSKVHTGEYSKVHMGRYSKVHMGGYSKVHTDGYSKVHMGGYQKHTQMGTQRYTKGGYSTRIDEFVSLQGSVSTPGRVLNGE